MNCDELKLLADDYLENVLPERIKTEFEKYIDHCPDVKKYVETCSLISKRLSELPLSFDPPPQIITELTDNMMRLSDSKEKKKIEPAALQKIENRSRKLTGSYDSKEAIKKAVIKPKRKPISNLGILITIFVLLVISSSYFFIRMFNNTEPWIASSLKGSVLVNSKLVNQSDLIKNDNIKTDLHSTAKVVIPEEGEITLGENTSITITETRHTLNAIVLHYGKINFKPLIKEPNFETTYKDITVKGHQGTYSMVLDSIGRCNLEVAKNHIEITTKKDHIKLAHNYTCTVLTDNTINLPFNKNSSDGFRGELYRLNFNIDDIEALTSLLLKSSESDALTLLRVLELSSRNNKEMIYQKLSNLFPPPAKVTKQGIINGDLEMLNAWWMDINWQL